MLKILYMSDLHIEMERWRLPVPGWPAFLARHREVATHPSRGPLLNGIEDIDLVVMAGDIHNGLRGIVYAEQVAKFFSAPAVYVAGNHEFYGEDMARLLPAAATAAAHSAGEVYFLENTHARFTIRGETLNVLGCTLWTDYALHGDAEGAMLYAARRMNDHAFIKLNGVAFMPHDALARHRDSRRWLNKTMRGLVRANPEAKNLIVTHHAPCSAVLGKRTGPIAPAYGSEVLDEFTELKPDAWIHGHTHFRHESVQQGIRLVSAPRGYVTYDGSGALEYRPGVLEI